MYGFPCGDTGGQPHSSVWLGPLHRQHWNRSLLLATKSSPVHQIIPWSKYNIENDIYAETGGKKGRAHMHGFSCVQRFTQITQLSTHTVKAYSFSIPGLVKVGEKARITLSKFGVKRDRTNTHPSSISLKENLGHCVMIFMHVLYSTQIHVSVYVYPHFFFEYQKASFH